MSHKFLVVSSMLRQLLNLLTTQDWVYDQLAYGACLGIRKNLVLPHVSPTVRSLEMDPMDLLSWVVPYLGILLRSHRGNDLFHSPSCR